MANHTAEPTRRSILTRRIAVFGVSVPTLPVILTVLGAGVALAAILLTTNITGRSKIIEVATSNDVDVTASSVDGSALKCNVSLSADDTQMTLDPVLTKPVTRGNNGSNDVVPGGTCTLKFTVKNTGDTTIRVDKTSDLTVPAGWEKGTITGLQEPIGPGKVGVVTAEIIAHDNATEGDFKGQLVYTDAAA